MPVYIRGRANYNLKPIEISEMSSSRNKSFWLLEGMLPAACSRTCHSNRTVEQPIEI